MQGFEQGPWGTPSTKRLASRHRLGVCEMADFLSRHQLQSRVECSLFDNRTLAEPSGVHAILVAASTALVVDILSDRVEQTPSRAFGCFQLCPSAMTVIQAQHLR